MSTGLTRASEWLYHGVWKVLVHWFRVPAEPPTLPTMANETIQAFRPSEGFLRYLKFQFWATLVVIGIPLLIGWLIIVVASPVFGILTTPIVIVLSIIPPVLAYVAIHLRYDSTWYVVSDRSLRIRRGIWIIQETTITFENIQNVIVDQGPLQRWFGIADVLVKTAGGGGTVGQGHEGVSMGGHNGLIEGINNAPEIRDLIMARLRRSATAGLGDELRGASSKSHSAISPQHVAMLREIRDAAAQLANAS